MLIIDGFGDGGIHIPGMPGGFVFNQDQPAFLVGINPVFDPFFHNKEFPLIQVYVISSLLFNGQISPHNIKQFILRIMDMPGNILPPDFGQLYKHIIYFSDYFGCKIVFDLGEQFFDIMFLFAHFYPYVFCTQ
jgi:hypothetical protein